MSAQRAFARRRAAPAGRNTELAKIHIAAEQLGLRRPGDDSAYRDMLWAVGRVRSAKDLDAGGREAVLKHLRACGFKDRAPSSSRYERGTPAALIRFLWTRLADAGLVRDRSDRALRRYIAQHGNVNSDFTPEEIAPQHLAESQQRQIIEQLKRWLQRDGHEANG
jgi:phage gp16-like protein